MQHLAGADLEIPKLFKEVDSALSLLEDSLTVAFPD